MTCPNCQTICNETDHYCYRCGTALVAAEVPPAPKKGTHRVPLLILTAIALLGIALFFIIPMSDPVSETPWFYMENGTLYFDEYYYDGGSELTVPEIVDGQVVTEIGEYCFAGSTDLTTVILPDTVTVIGEGAFRECTALRGIHLPEGVELICADAFRDCTSLEAITIPKSVKQIGIDAFTDCEKLSYIFYGSTYLRWSALYVAHISPHTYVYCTDGTYLQP